MWSVEDATLHLNVHRCPQVHGEGGCQTGAPTGVRRGTGATACLRATSESVPCVARQQTWAARCLCSQSHGDPVRPRSVRRTVLADALAAAGLMEDGFSTRLCGR